MSAAGIVVAAGEGRRLGADRPKALVEVAGAALVTHAVRRLRAAGLAPVVVVHTPGHEADFRRILDATAVDTLVPGGATRTDSVRAGLEVVAAETVAVHDAARGLCPVPVIERTVAARVPPVLAVAPGLPVADTLKRVRDGIVRETLDRRGLWRVQTPQVFAVEALAVGLEPGTEATDDLALVERAIEQGHLDGEVRLVPGDPAAHKVTYPEDLALVARLAGEAGP